MRTRFASWWSRVGAALIDTAIVVGIAVGVRELLARYVLGESVREVNESYGLQLGTAMLAAAVYYPVLMWRTGGKTLGKMALKIRVVSINGRAMSLGVATTREVILQVGVIGGLASLPGPIRVLGFVAALLDYLWPLWDRENRALHDMVMGTRVIVMDGESNVAPSGAKSGQMTEMAS
jgi:uncharacterized RDD family membrane protein YckC